MAKMLIHSDVLFPISVPVPINFYVSTLTQFCLFESVLLWKDSGVDFDYLRLCAWAVNHRLVLVFLCQYLQYLYIVLSYTRA